MPKYTRIKNTSNFGFTNNFGFNLAGIKAGAGNVIGKGFNALNAISLPLMLAPLVVPGADTQLQAKIEADRLKEQENEMRLQGIEPPAPVTNTIPTREGSVRTTNMNPKMIQKPPMRPNSL